VRLDAATALHEQRRGAKQEERKRRLKETSEALLGEHNRLSGELGIDARPPDLWWEDIHSRNYSYWKRAERFFRMHPGVVCSLCEDDPDFVTNEHVRGHFERVASILRASLPGYHSGIFSRVGDLEWKLILPYSLRQRQKAVLRVLRLSAERGRQSRLLLR